MADYVTDWNAPGLPGLIAWLESQVNRQKTILDNETARVNDMPPHSRKSHLYLVVNQARNYKRWSSWLEAVKQLQETS